MTTYDCSILKCANLHGIHIVLPSVIICKFQFNNSLESLTHSVNILCE